MNLLEDKALPHRHVFMLYCYMDKTNCDLCNSICNTLDVRDKHWRNDDFFDPFVHELWCGIGWAETETSHIVKDPRPGTGERLLHQAHTQPSLLRNAKPGTREHEQERSAVKMKQDTPTLSAGDQQQSVPPAHEHHRHTRRLALTERQTGHLRRLHAPSPFYVQECSKLDTDHESCLQLNERSQVMDDRLDYLWESNALANRSRRKYGDGCEPVTISEEWKHDFSTPPDFYETGSPPDPENKTAPVAAESSSRSNFTYQLMKNDLTTKHSEGLAAELPLDTLQQELPASKFLNSGIAAPVNCTTPRRRGRWFSSRGSPHRSPSRRAPDSAKENIIHLKPLLPDNTLHPMEVCTRLQSEPEGGQSSRQSKVFMNPAFHESGAPAPGAIHWSSSRQPTHAELESSARWGASDQCILSFSSGSSEAFSCWERNHVPVPKT